MAKENEQQFIPTLLGSKDSAVKEMFAQGVHWGHRTSRWHPNIKPYLYGAHRNVHIFDLNQTYDRFQDALTYLYESAKAGKVILLVGTRGTEKERIKNIAQECGLPAVWGEWAGGTLTNFKEVAKRIRYFRESQEKIENGELEKYTKKERHEFNKEYSQTAKKWEGLKSLEKLPDVVFLTNIKENGLAAREAKQIGIPTVAITDTNTDPRLITYPIPANDDAITSMQYILEKVREAIKKGKGQQPTANEGHETEKVVSRLPAPRLRRASKS